MHVKTLIFILGAASGIVIGELSMRASEIAIAAIMLALVQSVVMVIGKWRGAVGAAPLFIFLCSLGIFTGVVRTQLVEEKINYVCEQLCTFDAVVVSSPESKDEYQIFKVHLSDSDEQMLDVQVRVPLYPKYQIGETLRISGKVSIPEIIPPHGDKKSFDYASYLLTRNVGSETTYPHVEVIDSKAHDMESILGRWKDDMVNRIEMYVSSPASALASGMLFGASSMSKELTQTFRTTGLSHIIVLSGFNIAIVISFILFVFAFMPLFLRVGLATISVIIFVVMVGGEASVVRATLMAFIALLATLVGRAYVAQQALILSLFAILMYEPYALLHDVSLHLSFLATAGIVYLSKPLEEIFVSYVHITKTLRELFVTTIAAYMATLPYICYSFGTVSIYALIANGIVLPFVPAAMLVSFLVVVSSYILQPLTLLLGFIDSWLINFIIWVARTFEHLPFASFALTISFTGMSVLYLILAVGLLYLHTKRKNETQSTIEDGVLTDVISY